MPNKAADGHSDRGAVLVIALMAMFLLTVLGTALVFNSSTELMIAGHFRTSEEAIYAADAAVERAIGDLQTAADWDGVLNGASQSSFIDGPPNGVRQVVNGATIDLAQVTNTANCGHPAACTIGEMTMSTADRPWGMNNPFWWPYAYGPAAALVPGGSGRSNFYVAVWVADDQAETDDDPLHDGVDAGVNPGAGVIQIRAEAFGPQGAHKVLRVTIERRAGRVRVISWRASR